MNQPLAVVVYERLLPGSQMPNRLQDLKYRVHTLSQAAELPVFAETHLPIVALIDMEMPDAFSVVKQVREHAPTNHLPIIGFSSDPTEELKSRALQSGFTMVAGDATLIQHLPQLLQQALHVD
jgi:CheY-like chemotaxis protein